MVKTTYEEDNFMLDNDEDDTLVLTLPEYLRTCTTNKLLYMYKEMTPWYKGETLGYEGLAREIVVRCGMTDSILSLSKFYQDTAIELLSRIIHK